MIALLKNLPAVEIHMSELPQTMFEGHKHMERLDQKMDNFCAEKMGKTRHKKSIRRPGRKLGWKEDQDPNRVKKRGYYTRQKRLNVPRLHRLIPPPGGKAGLKDKSRVGEQ